MFSSQFILDVKIVRSTSRGHTGFLIHLPSAAVLALTFLVRGIPPFLSLVDRDVEFLRTNDLIVLHLLGIYFILFIYLVWKKKKRYRDSNSRPNASEGYEPNELHSMSRFTVLQFTDLPCLPLFFFRATPSPRFTGDMPVYRGDSFFHARGAPPAAAHSHTRCCTQHNTTRWVLRAAANTCLHTMPCAAGELCQLSDSTTTPEFSCCGPCGGRLHRICGDPDDDEEVNRICEPCAAAKKSTSSTYDHSNAAKRKEGGGILQQSAPKKRKGETRKRLTLGQKREILQLLDQKVLVYRYMPVYRFTGLPCLPFFFGLATTGR